MKKKIALIALGIILSAKPNFAGNFIDDKTTDGLSQAGFSDTFISKIRNSRTKSYSSSFDAANLSGASPSKPSSGKPAVGKSSASGPPTVEPPSGPPAGAPPSAEPPSGPPAGAPPSAEPPSMPPSGPPTGGSPSAEPPSAPPSDVSAPPDSASASLPPMPAATPSTPKASKKEVGSESSSSKKASTKSSHSKKGKGKKSKKSKKKKTSAPVVQSFTEDSGQTPVIPPISGSTLPPLPFAQGNSAGQEIYSQEPLLSPVNGMPPLPLPSRTSIPPLGRDSILNDPFDEAFSRVLACSFSGLTGLNQTVSADVSREGTFKMGFHSNWFTLDRVYNRVLAAGESGEIFEIPLFFNYAVTNDLEFAFMLPIENYTLKTRILTKTDFQSSGVGDTKFMFKYRVFDNPQYMMRGAFGLGFKFPTGSSDKSLGTGATDFEVFTAFSKNFENIIAHLNLGYIKTGDPNNAMYPNGLADIFYYNLGIEYPHTNNVTVIAEVNGQDWGGEGLKVDVTPSLRYTPTENFSFDIGVPVSITNDQRYGYNYRLTFGVTSFFR
ncbi:MAG: transporter [Candidatus Riflebacteria bacterium]|nr:transporter [Candidatus Riflebacteria bacterium]